MKSFIQRLAGLVFGVLSGFDRLMFQGHLRQLCFPGGMNRYCNANNLKLVDFARHAQDLSQALIDASCAAAKRQGRPLEYLRSPKISKEQQARAIAQRDGVRDGLVAVFTCVEPCWSFSLRGNRATQKLEFRPELRKCQHVYHYYQHPRFGLVYGRVQSWFPFRLQIGLNGREWLARQLDAAGLAYRRHDNCITWVEDVARAQALLDAQLQLPWAEQLHQIGTWVHPLQGELLGQCRVPYYWSLKQSEWASDVLFVERAELRRRYQAWLRWALLDTGSADVLRFLGKKLTAEGRVPGRYEAEVLTDLGRRVDGLRIKHRVGKNSLKMYDKAAGQVLRVETTIEDPSAFKVYRAKENDPQGAKDWRVLRGGVADIHRRAQVSQAANERYLGNLVAVQQAQPLRELLEPLGRRVREPGAGARRLRGLRPLVGQDAALLEAVSRPEYQLQGLRNRDVVAALFAKPAREVAERRRRSAWASRQLRLLRAHGLLRKVPRTHRYQVTERGRVVLTALRAARQASTQKLMETVA